MSAKDGATEVSVPGSAWDIVCADRDEWKRRALEADAQRTAVLATVANADKALDEFRKLHHAQLDLHYNELRRLELDLTSRLDAESARAGVLARQNDEFRTEIRALIAEAVTGDLLAPAASHEMHLAALRGVASRNAWKRQAEVSLGDVTELLHKLQLQTGETERLRHGTPIEGDLVCPFEMELHEVLNERDVSYKPGDIRKIGGANGAIYVALAPNETHVALVFTGEDGVPKFSIHLGDEVALGLAEAMTEIVKVAREIAAKRVW